MELRLRATAQYGASLAMCDHAVLPANRHM